MANAKIKHLTLEEAGLQAIQLMKSSVWSAEQFGNVTLAEAVHAVEQMARVNGFSLADVEKEAQRISLLKK